MTTIELPPELKKGLEEVKERDGIPHSEQIRRALKMWLESKGIDVQVGASEPTMTTTIKRPRSVKR